MTILAMVNENMAVSIIPQLAIPDGYPNLKFIPLELDPKLNRKLYFSFNSDSKNRVGIDNFKKLFDSYLNK